MPQEKRKNLRYNKVISKIELNPNLNLWSFTIYTENPTMFTTFVVLQRVFLVICR